MNEKQIKAVTYLVATLCLLAVAGLTLWAIFKTMTAIEKDEPLVYKNEKNLRELKELPFTQFPDQPEDGWDGKG